MLPNSLMFLLFIVALLQGATVYGDTLAASSSAALYTPETQYTIFRKGKKIGTHRLSVSVNDEKIVVTANSSITVRVLKIPVFKFRYSSEERWENGILQSVMSTTQTNSDSDETSLKNNSSLSVVSFNESTEETTLISHATNHWHIEAVKQTRLFNTIKGAPSNVTVTATPNEQLNISNKPIQATRYDYTGDLQVSAWYDNDGRWVKLAFKGTDGSDITYLIDTP